ncbi:C39 family peptidase [Micromonospora sp. WMMD882]|uniref:C39 family peptidase n=1 Tax=Micromonospora sp. WMMD882 TaxID=3015151 RepID=UPI00248AD037|nr:C39 family peptidase [Micromonospora sp. WMMD882]WBB77821.1 C39 family peptidase [Micromonospora sp. WMMD882]
MNWILRERERERALAVAGLVAAGLVALVGAAAGSALAGPTGNGPVAGQRPTLSTDRDDSRDRGDRRDDRDQRRERTVPVAYQAQPNFYYCGPAATRIALSADGKLISQDELAAKLGTTQAGTASAEDITRVLNELTGGGYRTTEIRGPAARPEQIERLRADVVDALDAGDPVVANIMGSAVDSVGRQHSYPGGHYLTVVAYRDGGDTVRIADPADPVGEYWMSTDRLAHWIAERGYSS